MKILQIINYTIGLLFIGLTAYFLFVAPWQYWFKVPIGFVIGFMFILLANGQKEDNK